MQNFESFIEEKHNLQRKDSTISKKSSLLNNTFHPSNVSNKSSTTTTTPSKSKSKERVHFDIDEFLYSQPTPKSIKEDLLRQQKYMKELREKLTRTKVYLLYIYSLL